MTEREQPKRVASAAEWLPIASLHGWDRNPRKHGKTVPKLTRAIIRYGWGSPIEARADNREIIAGHGRMQAAERLVAKWRKASLPRRKRWHHEAQRVAETGQVPVRLRDLDEDEAHQAALADNRIGQESAWDDDLLAEQLEAFEDDVDFMGFDDREVDKLLQGELGAAALTDDEGVPADADLVCVAGDVWQLGKHVLVCADNRERWAWPTEKAQAVWTDPPYGVEYVGKTADSLKIDNDQQDDEKLRLFLRSVFALLLEHTEPGACWYVAGPPGPQGMTFGSELMRIGVLRQVLVWVKDRWVMGRSDYHYRHEFVFYGWSLGEAHKRPPDRKQDTVFEFQRPSASKDHPTMKPPPLIGEQLSNSTKAGDLILDPHGGSGSTIIACEQLGLRCWMIEMSAQYCSGIIARWEKATGGKAERLSQRKQAVGA